MSAPTESAPMSLERLRSRQAFAAAAALSDAVESLPGLPILLRTQGLAAACWVHRGDFTPHILSWLAEWKRICNNGTDHGNRSSSPERFWDDYTTLSLPEAAAIEAEALRFAEQLKLFGALLEAR